MLLFFYLVGQALFDHTIVHNTVHNSSCNLINFAEKVLQKLLLQLSSGGKGKMVV